MRYRSKPVEIDAIQWTGENTNEIEEFVGEREFGDAGFVVTDGDVKPAAVWDYLHSTWVGVNLGDYIIRGTKNEFYPCDPEVFTAKYEPVDTYEIRSDEGLIATISDDGKAIFTGVITTSTVAHKGPTQGGRFG